MRDDRLIVFPLALLFIGVAKLGAAVYGCIAWLGIFPKSMQRLASEMREMNVELRELVRDMLR